MTLEGKSVVGSGRTKKVAKSAAARKYRSSKLISFMDMGYPYPPPLAENSAKIINIF